MKIPKKLKSLDIKLLVLDVDGVLTDGKLYISDNGIEAKSFHIRDGLGLKLLMENDVEIAIISGRKSKATLHRMSELGIKHLYFGVPDKSVPFAKLKNNLLLNNENIVCVGDDLPDLTIMQTAGFSIAVADAAPSILAIADHILETKGGHGAVREACDMILAAK